MVRVFISYRRGDADFAARSVFHELCYQLREEDVFFDRSEASLGAGAVFPDRIRDAASRCRVMLVIVGRNWNPRRLFDASDWVRREIATALSRGPGECDVVPVLVDAGIPRLAAEELPSELLPLLERQWHQLLPDEQFRGRLDSLMARVTDLVWTSEPAARVDSVRVESALGSAGGAPWSPEDPDSPHAYDYKYVVVGARRNELREEVLAHARGAGGRRLTLERLRDAGARRRYTASQRKSGMFLQASAVLTRGEGMAEVLVAIRADRQRHLASEPRNVEGESCLIGTPLASFRAIDGDGHVPSALFRSLADENPWALFGRKLIVPTLAVESRYLGVGFNFEKPTREYLHLVWHVHCRESSADAVLVPARDRRDEVPHDVASWQPRSVVERLPFHGAPIDRAVVAALLGSAAADPRAPRAGFVPWLSFEGTRERPEAVTYPRDALFLDLLLLFRQRVHEEPTRWKGDTEARLEALERFLFEACRSLRVAPEIDVLRTAHSSLLRFRHRARPEEPWRACLVALSESDEHEVDEMALSRLRELAAGGYALVPELRGEPPPSVFALHVVRNGSRYVCQGFRSSGDPAPVHVVRVAAGDSSPLLRKSVAHGLIGLRSAGASTDGLLFTRDGEDETARLPGGKLEGNETPEQALRRELAEELGLEARHVGELIPVTGLGAGGGEAIVLTEVSQGTGLRTLYRFFPFVVALTPAGRARLRERACAPGPLHAFRAGIEEWRRSAFGFTPEYPGILLRALPPELLERHAIDWER